MKFGQVILVMCPTVIAITFFHLPFLFWIFPVFGLMVLMATDTESDFSAAMLGLLPLFMGMILDSSVITTTVPAGNSSVTEITTVVSNSTTTLYHLPLSNVLAGNVFPVFFSVFSSSNGLLLNMIEIAFPLFIAIGCLRYIVKGDEYYGGDYGTYDTRTAWHGLSSYDGKERSAFQQEVVTMHDYFKRDA